MLSKASVRRTSIPSHIIIWQGRQQRITLSPVQCVSGSRVDCSAVRTEVAPTVGVTYTLSVSKRPSVSTVRSTTACEKKRLLFFQVHSLDTFLLGLFLMVSASCQFYNVFCSHILGVDGNPFITTCIQTNLAVSAVYHPHMRDPEANSINVWVAIALPRDSVLFLHAYTTLWAVC